MKQFEKPDENDIIAVIKTNMGDISVKLFPEEAPKAVENFTTHAKEGYYDGLIFHRVIKDFMIQGGDPMGTGMGGQSIWGSPFEDEFDMTLRNFKGALSMANAGPNTNGSQFFIVQASDVSDGLVDQMRSLENQGFPKNVTDTYVEKGGTPWLDFKHTVFGQVFDGLDVVDNIAATPVGADDKPIEDVVIQKIVVK